VNRLLVIPVLVPFVTAMVLALLNGYPRLERAVNLASCAALSVFVFWLLGEVDRGGIQATVIGGWYAPWGIAFVADRLACIMLCLSMSVWTLVLVYTCFTATPVQERFFFHPLSQVLLLGVNWSFITGDLFNLFVAYEVMLLGSYGLMMVGATKQQVRQTLKYIAINSIGSTLFVVGCGLVYATLGTLNMADIAVRSAQLEGERAALLTAVSMLLMVVFALKAAAFPLFFWLPDSYPIVPAGLNGYFAGLLTKVGVYSLLRMFVLCFRQPGAELVLDVLLVLSGFTMLFGVLGAMCHGRSGRSCPGIIIARSDTW
jgi:multicomponent Na+:H+ antiporter subunit D